MRSMTVLSLALLAGCATQTEFAVVHEGAPLVDAERLTTRGDLTTSEPISESPLRPVREPKGIAYGTLNDWVPPGKLPEALIEMSCINDDCTQIYLTGASSTKADTYVWTVNDMAISEGEELELALPEIVEDSQDQSTLVNVRLEVFNDAGSDTFQMGILNGLMAAPLFGPTGPPVEPPERPKFTIVIGVRDCSLPVGISQFNGCLTTGQDITTNVTIRDGAVSNSKDLVYRAQTDFVDSVGLAQGVAWLVDPTQSEQSRTGSNANVWSQWTSFRFPRMGQAGSRHLTSYYTVNPNNGSLSVLANHFLGGGTSTTPAQLELTCTNGQATMERLDEPTDLSTLDGGSL